MNTYLKFALTPALAAAMAVPMAAPALAGDSQDIIVRSASALENWQAAATKDLNRSLMRAPFSRHVLPNNTIVQVTFTMDEYGEAQIGEVRSDNANWAARKSAKYAVSRLDNLDEVPVYNSESATFLANIIFAGDADTHRQLAKKLEKSERARLASASDESDYISLGS